MLQYIKISHISTVSYSTLMVKPANKACYTSGETENDDSKEFFGEPAFLSVSSQMHLEACAWLDGIFRFLNQVITVV